MDNITTRTVPPQFLNSLYLVGIVPRRVSSSDPRISYSLYIPPKHYNPDPPSKTTSPHEPPKSTLPKLPLLVYIHGTRRKLAVVENELAAFAEATPCAILAPLFPAGLDGPYDMHSYKVLRSPSVQSDLAVLSMLDEVGRLWPGIETDKVYMMGFSGGGQFAHRFLYLHPERLAAVSVGAPGRITFLDDQLDWPAGVKDVDAIFSKSINNELIAKVRIQLVIGSEDNFVHGGKELWTWLEKVVPKQKKQDSDGETKTSGDLEPMTRGRLDSLRLLQTQWKENGINADLVVIEGVSHVTEGVQEAVFNFLQPLMRTGGEKLV